MERTDRIGSDRIIGLGLFPPTPGQSCSDSGYCSLSRKEKKTQRPGVEVRANMKWLPSFLFSNRRTISQESIIHESIILSERARFATVAWRAVHAGPQSFLVPFPIPTNQLLFHSHPMIWKRGRSPAQIGGDLWPRVIFLASLPALNYYRLWRTHYFFAAELNHGQMRKGKSCYVSTRTYDFVI